MEAIGSISGVIGQVNSISGTIATAVEEQSATTSEMSRSVAEAARGAGEVAQNIQGVAQAAQSTSHGATDSQKSGQQSGGNVDEIAVTGQALQRGAGQRTAESETTGTRHSHKTGGTPGRKGRVSGAIGRRSIQLLAREVEE